MSIARITSLGAVATLASCNVYHPALQPAPYPESASVTKNGTEYLVAELENPTPAYVAPTPPPTIVLPAAPKKSAPAPVIASEKAPQKPQPAPPEPTLTQAPPKPQPAVAKVTPQKPAPAKPAAKATPAPQPKPVVAAAPKPAAKKSPAPLPPVEKATPAKPEAPRPAAVASASPAEPATDQKAQEKRAEEFAIEFAKTLPFPTDAEISAFPKVLSPDSLASTPAKTGSKKPAVLLDKVRKNLARSSAATRVPAPWASQPSAAAPKIPTPKPATDEPAKFDPSIESLSIIPGSPHDERLDFGLDLGPTGSFDFDSTSE